MTGKTHIVGGLLIGLIITQQINIDPGYAAISGMAALLPDIDTPTSKISSKVPGAFLVKLIFGHRGLWHSLLATGIIFMVINNSLLAGVAGLIIAGYLSHLLMDLFTPAGIPLLWPIQTRFSIPLVTTGGVAEYIVLVSMISITFLYVGGFIM